MNRRLGFLWALVASLALLGGCGGGDGSSPSKDAARGTGVISVTLDADAGAAAGLEGNAYSVAVYRSNGAEVDKKTANLSVGTKQIDFTGLPDGTLHLHVGLSATAGGVETGAVDTTFQGGGAAIPVVVRKGGAVSSVVVASTATSASVGATQRFYAAAKTDDGSYVLTPPAGFSWTTDTPNVALVDNTGLVTGVSQGGATIKAVQNASGASGSTLTTVLATGVSHGKWTIMVYMNAANSLYKYAPGNVNQMEAIANNPDVRFVVQWKQVQGLDGTNLSPLFDGTRRYLAAYDSTSLSSSNNPIRSTLVQDLGTGVDMGSPATLADFVAWTKERYPADHYALVLWSHGGGWYSTRSVESANPPRAIIYDDEKDTYLSLPDVRSALPANGLDVLSYDACLMQSAESLLEFGDRTKYIVGSEDNVPGTGLPYNLVFKPFVSSPDTSTADLTAAMVNAYVDRYKDDSSVGFPVQMSSLDTSKASTFQLALDNLGMALANDPAAGSLMKGIRASAQRIEPADGYWYFDVAQLSTLMAGQATLSDTTRSAAAALSAVAASAVAATANGASAANFKGLSIEFAPSQTFANYATGYSHLRAGGLTAWDEFLASATANPQ